MAAGLIVIWPSDTHPKGASVEERKENGNTESLLQVPRSGTETLLQVKSHSAPAPARHVSVLSAPVSVLLHWHAVSLLKLQVEAIYRPLTFCQFLLAQRSRNGANRLSKHRQSVPYHWRKWVRTSLLSRKKLRVHGCQLSTVITWCSNYAISIHFWCSKGSRFLGESFNESWRVDFDCETVVLKFIPFEC